MSLQKENGFTLLELLIGMLLLTFGLLSAITLETACIRSNSMAARMDEATNLAQSKLEELCNAPKPAAVGEYIEPSLDATGTKPGLYTRTAKITDGPTGNTKRVRVEVTWTGGIGNRLVELQDVAAGGAR